jgi:hypothetical protein
MLYSSYLSIISGNSFYITDYSSGSYYFLTITLLFLYGFPAIISCYSGSNSINFTLIFSFLSFLRAMLLKIRYVSSFTLIPGSKILYIFGSFGSFYFSYFFYIYFLTYYIYYLVSSFIYGFISFFSSFSSSYYICSFIDLITGVLYWSSSIFLSDSYIVS